MARLLEKALAMLVLTAPLDVSALQWSTDASDAVPTEVDVAPGFAIGNFFFLVIKDDSGSYLRAPAAGVAGLGPWERVQSSTYHTVWGDPSAVLGRSAYTISWGRVRTAVMSEDGLLSGFDGAMEEGHIMEASGQARGPIWSGAVVGRSGGENFFYSVSGFEYQCGPGGCAAIINDVFYARVKPDGFLENFQATEPLPEALMSPTEVFAGGYIYSLGGHPSNDYRNSTDSVYCAEVLPDGRLGGWNRLDPLPFRGGGVFAFVGDDGYVHIAGGERGADGFEQSGHKARILAGGLGAWEREEGLPAGIGHTPYGGAAGYAYIMVPSSGSSIVYYAPLGGARKGNSLPEQGEVSGCLAAGCPAGKFCNARTGECEDRPGCRINNDCAQGQNCSAETRSCAAAQAWLRFDPAEPEPGGSVKVLVNSGTGFTNVALSVSGPQGSVQPEWLGVLDEYPCPCQWGWKVSGLARGSYLFIFTADPNGAEYGRGELLVGEEEAPDAGGPQPRPDAQAGPDAQVGPDVQAVADGASGRDSGFRTDHEKDAGAPLPGGDGGSSLASVGGGCGCGSVGGWGGGAATLVLLACCIFLSRKHKTRSEDKKSTS